MSVALPAKSDRSMLRRVLAPLLVVMALVAGPLAFTPAQADGGSISGVVTGAGGTPLEGVEVRAYYPSGYGSGPEYHPYNYQTAYTDSSGAYSFSLSLGTYRLEFRGQGQYGGEFFDNASSLATATDIEVGSAQMVKDAELAIMKAIKGKVTNPAGAAVAFARVTALQYDDYFDMWKEIASANTAVNGSYSLFAPAGSYKLKFSDPNNNNVDEYWSKKATPELADAVELSSTADTLGKDAQLMASPRITGTVTKSGGGALRGIPVIASPAVGYSTSWAWTEADGSYSLPVQPNGSYKLTFADQYEGTYRTEYWDNQTDPALATSIDVGTTDVAGKDAQLATNPTISGTVTSVGAGELENVQVTAFLFQYGSYLPQRSVQTGVDGRYTLPLDAEGTYKIEFNHSDYATQYFDDRSTLEDATPIEVTGSQTGRNVSLRAGAAIKGTVTGPHGPARVSVTAYKFTSWGGVDGYWTSVKTVQTKADGSYSLMLQPGTYGVGFRDENSALADEFYDNKTTVDESTPVTLGADGQDRVVDAQLAARATISGRVTGDGQPVRNAYVEIYREVNGGGPSFGYSNYVYTDSDGRFSKPVPPGRYKLMFSANGFKDEYFDDEKSLDDAAAVVVGATDVTGLDADLARVAVIQGTVRVDGSGALLPNVTVTAETLVEDGDGGAFWREAGWEETGSSGTFSMPVKPGSYRLKFDAYGNYRTEYYDNVTDPELASTITVDSTDVTANASLALNPAVSGKVTKAGNVGLADIRVSLLSERTDDGGNAYWDSAGSGYTSNDGTYSVRAPAGIYKLKFEDPERTYKTQYYIGKATADEGEPVDLPAAGLTGLNAVLDTNSTISGNVTGPAGAPADGVDVTVYQQYGTGIDAYWDSVGSTTTSTTGAYTVGVADGTYRLGFGGRGSPWQREYWNDKVTLEEADDIEVDGADVINKDAELAATSGVSGTVTIPGVEGESYREAQVTVYRQNGGDWKVDHTTYVEDGPYSLDLAPGTYRLKFTTDPYNGARLFEPIYYDDSPTFGGAKNLVVRAGVVEPSIDVTFGAGQSVTNSTVPSISGTPQVGSTLTASDGVWAPSDVELSRQWLRDGDPIRDATGSTYVVSPDDVGSTISVRLKGAKTGLYSLWKTSAATAVVADSSVIINAVLPTVSGTPTVGQALIANVGTWAPEPVSKALQWLRNGALIPGATGTTYLLTAADLGGTLSVEVVGTKGGYAPLTSRSRATATVAAPPDPPVVTPPAPPIVGPPAPIAKKAASISVTAKGAKKKATLTITVKASGVKPTGKITIKLGGKTLKTVTLKNGKAKVTLTKQKKGKRAYKVIYAGDSRVNAKTVTSKKVTIK